MSKYENAKIYKMISPNGLIYIGSTTQTLAQRKASHKRKYKNFLLNKKDYTSSFLLFEEDENNIDIVLLENYSCNSKEELHKKEREYIDLYECVNLRIPSRPFKEYLGEYYLKNKEKIKENNKKAYERNIEKLKKINYCDCGGKYTHSHYNRHLKTKRHINYVNSL